MNENSEQPNPPHGGWWFGWLLAIVVLPPIAAWLVFSGGEFPRGLGIMLGCMAVVLHIFSCVRLAPKGGCLSVFLFFGGYALLLGAVLLGCAMNAPY
jgi:hypothetical protein